MSAQVDHDLLADYVGGALDGTPEADRVARLISTSPAWRDAASELTHAVRAVSDDLAVLRGTPEEMPEDLVARFDELLSSPAMAPLAAKSATDPLAARSPARKVASGKRWRKWATPVAVLAGAAAFFAIGNLPSLTQSENSTTQPAMVGTNDQAGKGEALAYAVPTITSGRHHNRSSLSGQRATADTAAPTYERSESSPRQALGTEGIPPELARLTDSAALRVCLDAVALALPGKPTLIDYAYFEGNPALVISITAVNGRWMFVAGPRCGIKGADEIFRTPLQ